MHHILTILFILQLNSFSSQQRPLKVFVSNSAYYSIYTPEEKITSVAAKSSYAHLLQPRGGFAPPKKIKGGKGLYKFEFYSTSIVVKKGAAVQILTIKNVRVNKLSIHYDCMDNKKNDFEIEFSTSIDHEGKKHISIDLKDFNQNHQYKSMISCSVSNQEA